MRIHAETTRNESQTTHKSPTAAIDSPENHRHLAWKERTGGRMSAINSLAAALGRIPSGLFILTVRHGAKETAMLASWVQQCSFDPPRVTVAIKKGRELLRWLTDDAAFVLNVLPEGAKSLIGHFGKGFELGEEAFNGIKLAKERETAPVIAAAHAYLGCRVVNRIDAGDHVLLVAGVETGAVINDGKPTVHLRKNGLTY
jgi:flavin reductase (DIM6/NTAB) family NADH-FMN oxidoreductase RutF